MYGLRTTAGLAACQGHGSAHSPGLGPLEAGLGGRPLPPSDRDQCGGGPPEYPYAGRVVCDLSSGRGLPHLAPVAFHDTPKHGSWLNRAAIEFAVVSTPGLDRRLGDQARVRRAVAAWETQRNAAKAIVDWRFTTAKARRKLRHLYPL